MGWYTVGVRWLIIMMLVVAWGCGKSADTKLPAEAPLEEAKAAQAELPAKTPLDVSKAARAELRVLEDPGLWQLQNTVTDSGGQTNRNTATTQVSWAVNGHCLLLETEINIGGQKAYELVVKHYDSSATTNHYRSTWFQNDGLVRGFAGRWSPKQAPGRLSPKQALMEWEPIYLPSAPDDLGYRITEIFTGPREKQLHFQITAKGKISVEGRSSAKRTGPYARPTADPFPFSKELKRLGRDGIWKETQTVFEGGVTKDLEFLSHMRWSRGGKFLINEGVVDVEGTPKYFMWVKTWDTVDGVYRWAYFFQDGPVDHFTGYWDAAKQTITWHCARPGLAIALRESLLGPEKRSWVFEAQTTAGIVATGSGKIQFQGKAE